MAPTRRDLLKTGAAVAAAAAATRTLAQAPGGSAGGTFYEKGDVRIRYLDTGGSGFPLLVIPGGGLNSTISGLINSHPFNAGRGVQGRVPRHHVRSAQRVCRRIDGPARDRPAVGRVHGRPRRPHGSLGHRQVHGARLLHRRTVHLEPARARAESRRRRGDGATERHRPEQPSSSMTTT